MERRTPGQQLVQHAAEGVEVGAAVHVDALGLLRRHVRDGADRVARQRQPRGVVGEQPRDAEVDDLDVRAAAATIRLLGLMSRCTTPAACAAARPALACSAMRSTLATGNSPILRAARWSSMLAREMPRRQLHDQEQLVAGTARVERGHDVRVPEPGRAPWPPAGTCRSSPPAGRGHRSAASSTSFTATGRRVAMSLPRQTSPDAPRPSGTSSSYRPAQQPLHPLSPSSPGRGPCVRRHLRVR